MKQIIAVNDLLDNLAEPQIPWPLVHPLATFDPTPTKIPPIIKPNKGRFSY